jgi:hypothetical protein
MTIRLNVCCRVFFEWLLNGDKSNTPEDTLEKLGMTSEEHCQQYESYV